MGQVIERFPAVFPLGIVLLRPELVCPCTLSSKERYKLMIGECIDE